MRLFSKKADPVTERAKVLNEQIAALEAEIRRLAEQQDHSPAAPPCPAPLAHAPTAASAQLRLRSTARPHGQTVPTAGDEPMFEELNPGSLPPHAPPATPAPGNDLGVRKSDLASNWQRLKNHFRGPVASNPKLVHYLSAGSIQGLRPLRYEKRVARNRFIVLALFLVLALWGIIAIFISRK